VDVAVDLDVVVDLAVVLDADVVAVVCLDVQVHDYVSDYV
jgi:hypothetical protein